MTIRTKTCFAVFILATLLVLITGCITGGEDPATFEKVYLDNVQVIPEANALTVEVAGTLPSPAYTFERFDVTVTGNVIEIIPTAKYDPDIIVTQNLVSFEAVHRIENLESGLYKLLVIGKDSSITMPITIEATK